MALINFSIPTIPSFTSTTPDKTPTLFVPDVKYLVKFAQGDIGIADGIKKGMLLKNIGKMTNLSQLETFMKATGSSLPNSLETYIKNGKVLINPIDLSLGTSDGDLGGLKAMEKAMIQSIFETQKPYIEIIKLVTENLVKIEDIVARVLAVGGSSMRPANNPKALGYKGNSDLSSGLFKLDALKNIKTNPKSSTNLDSPTPDNKTDGGLPSKLVGITQSIVYSTGQFDPTVDYTYIYKDIKDDSISLPDGTASIGGNIDDDGNPNVIIFGVYDSDWNLVSQSLIDTPIQTAKVDGSISKNINWIKRSGKYFGTFPQIKPDIDFIYQKDRNGNTTYYNNDGPSIDVNGEKKYVKNGFPKIKSINTLLSYYKNYYLDSTNIKLDKRGITASTKQEVISNISQKLDQTDESGVTSIQTLVEGILQGGFLSKTNSSNTVGLRGNFDKIKFPYKPLKISTGVWVDPESKYDMKIIKCDSSSDVEFYDVVSKSVKKTKIIRFVKSTISIKLSNDSLFNYDLTKDGKLNSSVNNVNEFILDNSDSTSVYNLIIKSNYVPDEYKNGFSWDDPTGNKYRFVNNNGSYKLGYYYGDEDRTSYLTFPRGITFPNGKKLHFNKSAIFDYTEVFNGSLVTPKNTEKQTIIIDSFTFNKTITTGTLPAKSIRVKDDKRSFGTIISNTQITNEHLVTTKPYSKVGLYGTPITSPNLIRQNVEQIYRYMLTEDDTETYYIVEGILSNNNNQKLSADKNGTSANGDSTNSGGDYLFSDVVGAIPVFIEMLIDVFSKLIPAITELLTLIQNPAKFITDIIIAKLGDNFGTEAEKFGFFSKEFLDDLKRLYKIGSNVVDTTEKVANMKDFLNTSKLKNYVHVNESGDPRFILDGIAAINLFGDAPILKKLPGVKFGIETKLGSLASSNPQPPFSLVFNGPKPSSLKTLPDLSGLVKKETQRTPSDLHNTNFDPVTDIPSEIKSQSGVSNDVSIQYSTGTYKSDVDYTYLYATDYTKGVVEEAQKLADAGDIPKALNLLDSASKENPNDELLKEKIDELLKLTQLLGSQPILDFILNIVSLPLKVIFGIISYIMDFFKSLINPFELPGKIVDFVSFKWMADFFSPASKNSMFAMAGLLFDIQTFLTVWLPSLEAGTMDKFDLNKIMKFPWVSKLPTYNREQFRTLIYGLDGGGIPRMLPIMMLSSILCLIEGIINGFIDFVWGLLGLGALIPPPHIKLCKDTNGDLSPKDIMDLLNGEYFDDSINGRGEKTGYNFIYNIKTSDGRDVRDLNQIELDKWIEENKDLQFIFNV